MITKIRYLALYLSFIVALQQIERGCTHSCTTLINKIDNYDSSNRHKKRPLMAVFYVK